MKNYKLTLSLFFAVVFTAPAFAQEKQSVEGFDAVVFQHVAPWTGSARDFRGVTPGYMTAPWWAPGPMKDNRLAWRTAAVPEKRQTVFSFIASSAVLPAEITVGPEVRMKVNGQYALTFNIGRTHNYVWTNGDYVLKYISKRTEFPYTIEQRQRALNGNSGIYELTVPASAVEAGKPVVIEVEMLPDERWSHGWFMVKQYRDVLQAPTVESLEKRLEGMQKDINLLHEQTNILATQLYAEMLGNDKLKHNIVYTNGCRHLHPADIIKLHNGDILLFTREATEHYANDGDIVMVRSKDNGKTWGDGKVVSAIKDLDEREGCGIQLKDGTIVLGIYYNDLYLPNGIYNWAGEKLEPRPDRPRLSAHFITSNDNGETWQQGDVIDIKGMPFTGIEGPTDAPIEMPDGSIVMAVTGYGTDGDPRNTSCVFLRSTDKAKTWKYVATITSDPGGEWTGFVEPGIMRTKTGRLIAGMRNHVDEGAIYISRSDDDGKTWTPRQKTKMVGHPADLAQLSDGRILASYGVRPGAGHHTEPGGIRACFSYDNGETWDIDNEVILRNDFMDYDIGYPESIEMPDGEIMTVYYFTLFGKFYIGSTFWKP